MASVQILWSTNASKMMTFGTAMEGLSLVVSPNSQNYATRNVPKRPPTRAWLAHNFSTFWGTIWQQNFTILTGKSRRQPHVLS